jgi:hypothetical protein
VPTDGADAGAKAKGFQRSSCENLWVRGNLSGHFVNLMFAAGDLYKVHCPINLQVNPDRSTAIAMEKKTGSCQRQRRDFSLCKALRSNGLGLCEEAELEAQMFSLAQMFIRIPNVQFSTEPAFLQNPCYMPFLFLSF